MNPWRGLLGLRREVWVVAAASLIHRMGTMVLPFLVLYLTEARGLSESQAGLSLTAYGAGGLLSGPLAGKLCDRLGAVHVFLASLLASGLFLIGFPFLHGYRVMLAVVFLWALCGEAIRPAAMTLIAEFTSPAQRKPAFSLYRLAVNMGFSIGPAVGGFLVVLSYYGLFAVDAATSLLAFGFMAVLFLRLRVVHVTGGASEPSESSVAGASPGSPLKDWRFLCFACAMLPVTMVYCQVHAAYPLFLVRYLRLPESDFGLVFTLNAVLIILFEIPLNTWMIRWEHRRALSFGALLCAVGFGATGLVTTFGGVAGVVVVWSLGEMITYPTASAALADLSPEQGRGTYMGIYSMVRGTAVCLAPWLGTAVLQRMGPAVLWSGAFLVGVTSAAMLWFVRIPPSGDDADFEAGL